MGRCVGYYRARSQVRAFSFLMAGTALLLGVLTAGVATAADPVSAQGQVRVTASTREALRFAVDGLAVGWREVSFEGGAVVLHEPFLSGFPTVGEPGRPLTPRTGGWVLVPPGTSPQLVTIQEKWEPVGARPLLVGGVPVIIAGEEPGLGTTSEIMVLPGREAPADAPVPGSVRQALAEPLKARLGAAVVLGEVTWWRGHRIVPWSMTAVRHDAAGVASQSLVSGTWEVRFVPEAQTDKTVPPGHRHKTTVRGDARLSGIFLNGELLGGLPTEAAFRGLARDKAAGDSRRGGKSGSLLGEVEGRLAVTRTGLVRVSAARLRQLGYLPDLTVAEDQIRLYQRRYLERLDDGSGQAPYVEVEVPLLMVGEGDDFDGDDYFLFYGLRLRDDVAFTADVGQGPETIMGSGDPHEMNNPANIYWVAASEPDAGQAWERMEHATLPPATVTPLAGYRRVEHHEEQLGFRELQEDVNADRVYYNNHRATEVNVGFNPLWNPDVAGADVEIEIAVAGENNYTRLLQFQLVDAEGNITPLGDYDLATMAQQRLNYTVPASALNTASAKVVMLPRANRDDRVFSYLNWVNLSYDALYQTVGGKLAFHTGNAAGSRPIEVSGFTSAAVGLVEVTDPRRPVWIDLQAGNVVADGAGWKLSLAAVNATAEPRHFFAAQDVGTSVVPEFTYNRSSLALGQTNPVELAGPAPDLVVITHEEFRPALERWIQHRIARSGGELAVHTVLVQDIFDWYSGGLHDPWAIKRFTNHAITQWGAWALTLVGDANENALELDVLSSARDWSTDWVPTHYHVQDTGQYDPELMAADKWYATMQSGQTYPVEDFPNFTYGPWEMYVGRLPCNSTDELDAMIDKIIAVENVQPGQAWRRRGIFFADDAWSNGYDSSDPNFIYSSTEEVFARSERDSLAAGWRGATAVTLPTVELYLATYLDPYWVGHGLDPRPPALFKDYAESDANPPLLAALNAGGLVAHYQGHGNPYVLASEYWIEDRLGLYRKDAASLNNGTSPWVFFGMGCHIADWAQNPFYNESYPREQSLCEKFLVRRGGGASATYGSSGYEYIDANRYFGEYLFRRWLRHPLAEMSVGSGGAQRSRWMLGELLWAGEADILAVLGASATYRQMVAQYTLLGDPLMMLDAGEPEVTAVLLGGTEQTVTGEVDLMALDAANVRQLRITARDEAGIDRLEIIDQAGNDLTTQLSSEILPNGATDHQSVQYDLTVPIAPYDHQLTVKVFDTGAPLETDRHWELLLNLAQTCLFSVGGEVLDPASYVFPPQEPVAFSGVVTGSAWFTGEEELALTSENLDLSSIAFNVEKDRQLSLQFTAVAPEGTAGDRSVVLSVDGHETTYLLQEAGAELPLVSIGNVLNFPNPMTAGTRFVFDTAASGGQGVVQVFSVAGRHVARVPFTFTGGGSGIVPWDGRDRDGDPLGNGTYLYRIEMDTPAGRIASDMQRLVVMR